VRQSPPKPTNLKRTLHLSVQSTGQSTPDLNAIIYSQYIEESTDLHIAMLPETVKYIGCHSPQAPESLCRPFSCRDNYSRY